MSSNIASTRPLPRTLRKTADAMTALRALTGELRTLGVSSLSIYGSFARGEEHSLSDLDICVDYDPSSRFSLVTLAAIKQMIEETTGLKVDITTWNSIPEGSRAEIAAYALKVF